MWCTMVGEMWGKDAWVLMSEAREAQLVAQFVGVEVELRALSEVKSETHLLSARFLASLVVLTGGGRRIF